MLVLPQEEERMYPQPPFNPAELNLLYHAYDAACGTLSFRKPEKTTTHLPMKPAWW